jgi:hypothetical protein
MQPVQWIDASRYRGPLDWCDNAGEAMVLRTEDAYSPALPASFDVPLLSMAEADRYVASWCKVG